MKILSYNSADSFKFISQIFEREGIPITLTRGESRSTATMLYELQTSECIFPTFEDYAAKLENNYAMITITDKEYWCDVMLIWRNDNKNPRINDFLRFAVSSMKGIAKKTSATVFPVKVDFNDVKQQSHN